MSASEVELSDVLDMESHDENEESGLIQRVKPPKDRFKFVYLMFFTIGISTLLPWNFFITAKQYFMYKLRNITLINERDYTDPKFETEMQETYENYVAIAAMVPNILFMALNARLTKVISAKTRLVAAFILMIAMFILTIILVKVNTDTWQTAFFVTSLGTVVLLNAGSAVLQGGLFGLAGLFPGKYTQSVMSGMAMGGTFAAVAEIISLLIGTSAVNSAFGYFFSAESVLMLGLAAYLCLPNLKFSRYFIDQKDKILDSVNNIEGVYEESYSTRPSRNPSFILIFRQIWTLGFSVMLVFFVTLACFPGLNSNIKSMGFDPAKPDDPWHSKYFTPVTCFLLFNLGDLTGRTVTGWVQYPKEKSKLLPILCVLRIAFIPLFLLCNIQPRHHSLLPVVFQHDAWPIAFMVIFSVSNGYLGTLCMIFGPKRVLPEDAEVAGAMMSVFLTVGLASGSLFSLMLTKLVV